MRGGPIEPSAFSSTSPVPTGARPARATGPMSASAPQGRRSFYDPRMSIPVLATKLFAPTRRPQLVARPRLAEKLDTTFEAGHRLTLVSAPAGFGKTTLLSDWIAHLEQHQSHTRVGWLSLDDGDNDLTRLLTHLLAALDRVGLDVDATVLDSLHTAPTSDALTALVNDVNRAGEDSARDAMGPSARRLPRHLRPRRARCGDLSPGPPSRSPAAGDGNPLRSTATPGPAPQSRAAH